MIFSYNWLQSFFSKKLPKPAKLAELLTTHSFEVEEVKRIGNDWVLNIDVLPNRSHDCLSHIGVACECSALTNSKFQIPPISSRVSRFHRGFSTKSELDGVGTNSKPKEEKKITAKDFIKIEVEDKQDCPRYTARVITDVKVGNSPSWIQERLKVCGLRPINNIVDIANYVMLEMGQPLHAFDFDKLSNIPRMKPNQSRITNSIFEKNSRTFENYSRKTIIVRKAKKGEKITTLDDEKYDLDEDILVIANDFSNIPRIKPNESRIFRGNSKNSLSSFEKNSVSFADNSESFLAIAGIKGGKKAEIDENTKIIVLESANFDLRTIRRTSRKLNLRTDASIRFEQGLDPNLAELAINRAAYLIQNIGAGKTASGLIDFYPQKSLPKKIKLDLNYVEKLLGTKIPPKEIVKILTSLKFKLKKSPVVSRQLVVEIPTPRLDINLQEDVIEEIGRIYGYRNIIPKAPILPISPPAENRDYLWEKKIKEIIKGLGFNEIYLYSFISEDDADLYLLSPEKFISTLVEIENPTSIDAKYLRPSLLLNLLKGVNHNQEAFKEIKLFEIGKTYRQTISDKQQATRNKLPVASCQLPVEKKILAGVVVGEDKFYELKGCIESLFESLGIVEIFFDSFEQTPEEAPFVFWERELSAEIREKTGNIELGFLGKIRDEVLEFYKLKKPVFAFEIDFEKLLKMVEEEHEYEPPSPYPETFRDLSILVPLNALAGDVIQALHFFGDKVLRDVEVIDIFEGEPLPEDKKNLTFTLIFQSKEKTLSSKEIDKIMDKIIKGLEENIDWEVRR